jgi:putative ABC transport system permease protein
MIRLLWLLASRRSRGRAALTVLGIALGVALGYGVHLVNRAAVRDLAASVRELAGQADLEVRGGRSSFAESLYPEVAHVAGVAWVKPGLELDIGIAGTQRTLRVLGIDAVREGRPELLGTDKVLLSAGAAQIVPGDRLPLAVGGRTVELEIAGTVPLKGAVALTDIATAQWRLERLGELNRLDIGLARAADREEVRKRVAALLPPGVFVSTIDEKEQESAYPSRAYRVNMNALALVALFTGGFLVFSAQALETARRRGEHALLRVLGLRRADISRLVLLEAALLGALGGALGITLGYAFAAGAVHVLGADLGSGAFRGLSPELGFPVLAAALYFLAGVAVAILGALLPALDASAAPPARALKAGDEQRMLERISPAWPGLLLLAAGGGLAQLGPVAGLPLFGYLAIACVLLGSVALMPFISQMIFRAISVRKPAPLVLALAQLRGAPGQAAVSLAAIVASYALMAAMAIMVASFRESVDRWLDAVLPADVYVRSAFAGDAAYLDPRFEAAARALPQVARADFLRVARIVLDPSRPALPLIARDRAAKAFPMAGKTYPRRPGDPPAAWISEAVSDLYGLSPGEKVAVPMNGANHEFIVSGVFRDYARQHGAILIDRADYIALTGDRRVNDASLWLKPGATAADAMAAVRLLPGGAQLEIVEPGEIRRLSLRIFDRSFAATYAMEAVAMLVGLFGLSSSLGAIVLARRREFGMLRHLGVTRAQVAAMLAAEGGLLALVGAFAGLAAGGAISLILVYVVNRQSFNWSMELHLPLVFIASLTGILIALAVITAVFAGREAMGLGPVRAVREDW